MAKETALVHTPPRTAELEPAVARAWDLNGGVVMSFTHRWAGPPPEEHCPRIVVVPKDRVQDALDRACKEFGDPEAPPFPSAAMLTAARRRA